MYCHGLNRQTIRHADFHRTHGLFSILASYFVKIVSRAQTHNFLDQETTMAAGPLLGCPRNEEDHRRTVGCVTAGLAALTARRNIVAVVIMTELNLLPAARRSVAVAVANSHRTDRVER